MSMERYKISSLRKTLRMEFHMHPLLDKQVVWRNSILFLIISLQKGLCIHTKGCIAGLLQFNT